MGRRKAKVSARERRTSSPPVVMVRRSKARDKKTSRRQSGDSSRVARRMEQSGRSCGRDGILQLFANDEAIGDSIKIRECNLVSVGKSSRAWKCAKFVDR